MVFVPPCVAGDAAAACGGELECCLPYPITATVRASHGLSAAVGAWCNYVEAALVFAVEECFAFGDFGGEYFVRFGEPGCVVGSEGVLGEFVESGDGASCVVGCPGLCEVVDAVAPVDAVDP